MSPDDLARIRALGAEVAVGAPPLTAEVLARLAAIVGPVPRVPRREDGTAEEITAAA